jgi:hypothetical protein
MKNIDLSYTGEQTTTYVTIAGAGGTSENDIIVIPHL